MEKYRPVHCMRKIFFKLVNLKFTLTEQIKTAGIKNKKVCNLKWPQQKVRKQENELTIPTHWRSDEAV